jgi:membrane protein YqaA with SNARE-associated domain
MKDKNKHHNKSAPHAVVGDKPSKWAFHKKLYDWVLSLAHKKYVSLVLFLLAIAESSFFPVAPDFLQIALTLEKPKNVWWYAGVNAVGSVLGGILGYALGAALWPLLSSFFFRYIFSEASFEYVGTLYNKWHFLAVFAAAFTPIPYKVFTLAAGVYGLSFPLFVLASVVGRSARFFLVAALLYTYGSPVKIWIEKYFNLLTLAAVCILIAGFLLINLLV